MSACPSCAANIKAVSATIPSSLASTEAPESNAARTFSVSPFFAASISCEFTSCVQARIGISNADNRAMGFYPGFTDG